MKRILSAVITIAVSACGVGAVGGLNQADSTTTSAQAELKNAECFKSVMEQRGQQDGKACDPAEVQKKLQECLKQNGVDVPGQQPGQPGQQPGQPGQPGQDPQQPGQPGQPGQPQQPGQPGQPGQPQVPDFSGLKACFSDLMKKVDAATSDVRKNPPKTEEEAKKVGEAIEKALEGARAEFEKCVEAAKEKLPKLPEAPAPDKRP
jgi:hypothetical protein